MSEKLTPEQALDKVINILCDYAPEVKRTRIRNRILKAFEGHHMPTTSALVMSSIKDIICQTSFE